MPRSATLLPLLLFLALAGPASLSGGVALLVGEPIGRLAFFTPTGHAAIYLSRVCAESPIVLRRCRSDESGVVISRYRRISGYDWIATPLLGYLYSVNEPEDIPEFADTHTVMVLRENYRRLHLLDLAPDDEPGEIPKGDWVQLLGAAYVRNLHGFYLPTTPEDDDRLIDHLNSMENRVRFNLLYRNCADFARSIVNFYYPGALRRNIVADLGISTPKGAARSLVKYSRRRPDVPLSRFVVSQIPGLRPSTRTRGVTESLIRSKKYVLPLAVFQPWVAVGAAAAYLGRGRFNPSGIPQSECEPFDLTSCLEPADKAGPGT